MEKNILLIGGSTGIGLEIAKKLHKEHNIYIASRSHGDIGDLEVNHLEFDVLKDDR